MPTYSLLTQPYNELSITERSLTIAGVERWNDIVDANTLKINQAMTYQVDTASFKIKGEQPNEGEEVIITEGDKKLFAGIIVKVELKDKVPVPFWFVDCDDYTAILDKKLVIETYNNMAVDLIFKDIATKYCIDFTVNNVQPGAPIAEYLQFDYLPPSECFKQLCEYVGWQWTVDYEKDLHFFDPAEILKPAPMSLEPGGNFRMRKHTVDMQGLRNRVYVLGGKYLSHPIDHPFVSDGVQRIWVLPHEPHSPRVVLGDASAPEIVPGLEYVDEGEYDWWYNQREKYIKLADDAPTPVEGTTIIFRYKEPMPVITMVEDLKSQETLSLVQGGDGVYEHRIIDDSLITIEAAEALGQQDLREHANPRVTGSFETEVPGWEPGQIVQINLPDRGIIGEFLVQKVSISPTWPNPSVWTYTVEYGGRLLGVADFLQALVSKEQKAKITDVKYQQKFVIAEFPIGLKFEFIITPRTEPWFCGDADAICGEIVCLGGA